jgi:hypothetical protein
MNPELAAKYWKWIYDSNPKDNPLRTGVVNKDEDDVIMLPCTGGGAACDRHVILSGEDANKKILVPVFASMQFGVGEKDLLKTARRNSTADKTEMLIDDIPQDYEYIETKDFEIKGFEAVSTGFWHIHEPLPKGKHIIKFGGNGKYDDFFTKVQYDIEIE